MVGDIMSRNLIISDLGEFEVSETGDVWHIANSEHRYKLTPFIGKRGYLNFYVRKRNKRKHLSLHRLLALAFISNPNNLPEVRHLDGNKLNNSLDNLAWGTHFDNMSDKNWHHNQGENCGTSKLTWKIVRVIRKLLKRRTPVTQARLGDYFGVTQSVISDIKRGKTW